MAKPKPDPRTRIRAAALIRALEQHVLKDAAMKPTQVTAALALLRHALPDAAEAGARSAHEDALAALE